MISPSLAPRGIASSTLSIPNHDGRHDGRYNNSEKFSLRAAYMLLPVFSGLFTASSDKDKRGQVKAEDVDLQLQRIDDVRSESTLEGPDVTNAYQVLKELSAAYPADPAVLWRLARSVAFAECDICDISTHVMCSLGQYLNIRANTPDQFVIKLCRVSYDLAEMRATPKQQRKALLEDAILQLQAAQQLCKGAECGDVFRWCVATCAQLNAGGGT